jgi:hypothetical protein
MVSATQWDIFGQVFRNGVWGPEFTVSAGVANRFNFNLSAGTDSANQVMVVWRQQDNLGAVTFQSRLYAGTPAAAQPITPVSDQFEAAPALAVGVDDSFHIYGASAAAIPAPIIHSVWQPTTSTWTAPNLTGVSITSGQVELAAAADAFGGTWLLYANGQASVTGRYLRAGFSPDPIILAETSDEPRFPSAMRDAQDNIQLHFVSGVSAGVTEIHRLSLIGAV